MDLALFAATAVLGRYASGASHSSSSKSKSSTPSSTTPPSLSYALLQQQNAETSAALIAHYAASGSTDAFTQLATYEGDLTLARDAEDDAKLQVGIDFAKTKGVIDRDFVPEPYVEIDVLGQTPTQVAHTILEHVQRAESSGSSNKNNNVIVIVGLSGTGKGTTVAKLRQILQEQHQKKVVTWSNGNVFRCVTLLAATWCQQTYGKEAGFVAEKTLTKENLAKFMNMLTFDKFQGEYDTRLKGLGLDLYVSKVQNTTLKTPIVSKNIPTVAQATQGEVILFAANAVQRMGSDGIFVLLEGRAQTVNYVRTPNRFCLILSDPSLIGKRRAAQRLMGAALAAVQKISSSPTEAQMVECLDQVLTKMVQEM
jgi:cytidylate kinase